ncbi:Kelch repeat-containing protein At3g27220 [Linum perenne]
MPPLSQFRKHHHAVVSSATKLGFVLLSICLLGGAAFLVDFFWISSSSSSISPIAYNNISKVETNNKGKDSERILSATFADLPAPELEWEQMPSAPVPRLDGYSVQINHLLYVFVGYQNLDNVNSHVDVFNLSENKWSDRFEAPNEMANSHLGVATDGSRFVYIVSGQKGPQCRTAITLSYCLDTKTKQWRSLPPLPVPRYAPATQLWRGRLHVMGGSKENRHTPGLEHWSIAVKDGKALEKEWRIEVPIPRGGPHRWVISCPNLTPLSSNALEEKREQYLERLQVVYGDVYMLDDSMKWHTLAPMPKPDSHIECAWIIVNNSIVIVGGTTEKHPRTKSWSVIGKLPYRVKTTLVGYWDGWLYFTSGQRDRGPDNPQPQKVIAETWRTKLHLP